MAPWSKTVEKEGTTGNQQNVNFMTIACMPQYLGKSAEELRWEDYQACPLTEATSLRGSDPLLALPLTQSVPQQQHPVQGSSCSPFKKHAQPGLSGLGLQCLVLDICCQKAPSRGCTARRPAPFGARPARPKRSLPPFCTPAGACTSGPGR